jgi:hypothetical protein
MRSSSLRLRTILRATLTGSHREVDVLLEAIGGQPGKIKFEGAAGSSNITLSQHMANFGLLIISTEREMEDALTNEGEDIGFFLVSPSIVGFPSIFPPSGRLLGGEFLGLHATVRCMKPGKFEVPAKKKLSGQPPQILKVSVLAETLHGVINHDIRSL